MLDPVERDFNAFSKSQSYAEDFEEAVNERVQQEVEKFFDDLIIDADGIQAYLGGDNSIVIELDGHGFVMTPDALNKLSNISIWMMQEYNESLIQDKAWEERMAEENDKQRQWD